MSIPNNQDNTPDTQIVADLRSAIESLRGVFQVVALSGIVLSGTILLFLYKENSIVRKQNDELRAHLGDYYTNFIPKIEITRTNLEAFARSNPSITPLLRKYFPTNAPARVTSQPPSKP
jgi:hypothetical protein